jgi:predicted aconitase
MAGVTPEAPDEASAFQGQVAQRQNRVTLDEMETLVPLLDRDAAGAVSAVCIGAPHASAAELREVRALLAGRSVAATVQLLLTTNQAVLSELQRDGSVAALRAAGAQLVTGRCSYYRPALDGLGAGEHSRAVTPSAKWAWYARRTLDCAVAFRDLPACVEAAVSGAVQ